MVLFYEDKMSPSCEKKPKRGGTGGLYPRGGCKLKSSIPLEHRRVCVIERKRDKRSERKGKGKIIVSNKY